MNHVLISQQGRYPNEPGQDHFGWPTLCAAFDEKPAETIELVTFFGGTHELTPSATSRLGRAVIEGNAENRDEVVIDLGAGFELDGEKGHDWFFRNLTLVSSAEQDEALIRLKKGAKVAFENCAIKTHNPRYCGEARWPPAPPLRTFEVWDSTILVHNCHWHSDGVGAKTWGTSKIEVVKTGFEGHCAGGAPCVLSHGAEVLLEEMEFVFRSPLSLFDGKALLKNIRLGLDDDWWYSDSPMIYGGKAHFESCEIFTTPGIVIDGPEAEVEVFNCTFNKVSNHHFTDEYDFPYAYFKPKNRPHVLAICNFDSKTLDVRDCVFPEKKWIANNGRYGMSDWVDPNFIQGVTGYKETSDHERTFERPEDYDDEAARLGETHGTNEEACRKFGRMRGLLPPE